MRNLLKALFLGVALCGSECSALTVSGQVDGYDYVDLGLPSGNKWATYNVGATMPTEPGDLFAWGETTPKEDYSWSTYKWCENKMQDEDGCPKDFTKYCTESEYGYMDNKRKLETADDAATVNWGGAWRTPTSDEIKELLEACTWKSGTTADGDKGMLGVSNKNGCTIFLPVNGQYGGYWASSLSYLSTSKAYFLYFYGDHIDWSINERMIGHSVRAVISGKKYTVNFYGSDSTLISSQIIVEGRRATTVNAPEIEGYIFSGWSDSSYVKVTKDLDIYAKYIKNEDGKNGVTVSGKVGKYTYVDLGLSVKWATYNVGASQSCEYGDFFAWGETTSKEDYSWSTYKLCDGHFYDMTKYCIDGAYGNLDNKEKLEEKDDAATVNWGKEWRMPTDEEALELMRSCRWEWHTRFNGTKVSGYLGTSSVNGATIFLPAGGRYNGNTKEEESSYGYYWISEVDNSQTWNALDFYLYDYDIKRWDHSRNFGQNVRAVTTADDPTQAPKVETQALMVYAIDGVIKISGSQPNTNIQVFDMDGKEVKTAVTDGNGSAQILLSALKNVYVVTVGNQSTKVILK